MSDTNIYDVWLINFRGNSYSREHAWLDADSDESYWNFSFEEFGEYDLKASIQFIQNQRNDNKKLTLIGYSLGTTAIMYAMSL